MKYTVKLYPRAYRDLDEIYSYISVNLTEQGTADIIIADLENAIFSLEQFPKRGSIRRNGVYANQDYRQLFIKSAGGHSRPPLESMNIRRRFRNGGIKM